MKLATFYLLPAILLLAMIACSNSDDQAIDENLLDVVWRVDTLQTPEEEIVPGPDELLTIQFTKNLEVSGMAACNTYTGTYEIGKNKSLSLDGFGRTEIACSWNPYLTVLEDIFINTLENVTAYNVSENRLTLYDSDHQHVLNFSNGSGSL